VAQIIVKNLVKKFGDLTVIDNVSFTVPDQQIVTLLGPSGCGKSTILRCIAGLETPDAGMIQIGDTVMFDSEKGINVPTEKRNIGMVFQSYAIWPHLTVYDNVAFPLKLRKMSKQAIKEQVMKSLKLVGLEELANRYPSQLSGGQQQRVVIARCIVYTPTVMLLDEPLANLDAKLRDEMRVELRQIQQEAGLSAIYVTHDQSEAMALSDKVLVMSGGHILQEDAPKKIYNNPEHPFVASFIGNSILFDATVTALEGETPVVEAEGLGTVKGIGKGLQVGDKVKLGIRPTDFTLSMEKPDSFNCWEAKVDFVTYLGELSQYQLNINGLEVSTRVKVIENLNQGDTVYAAVDPSKARVLKEA